MSDYIPNFPNPDRDPRDYRRDHRNAYDPTYQPSGGRGLTLLVGILVAIALAAGVMFFTGPRDRSADIAQQPAQIDRRAGAGAGHPGDPASAGPAAAIVTKKARPRFHVVGHTGLFG